MRYGCFKQEAGSMDQDKTIANNQLLHCSFYRKSNNDETAFCSKNALNCFKISYGIDCIGSLFEKAIPYQHINLIWWIFLLLHISLLLKF